MALVYGNTAATGYTAHYAATHSPAHKLTASYGIPENRIHTFTSYEKFKEDLQRCADAFSSGAGKQYIAFSDVPESRMQRIEHGRCRSELPPITPFYDAAVGELCVKLVSGFHHQMAKSGFSDMVDFKLSTHGIPRFALYKLGSTTYIGQSGRLKEADQAFRPSTRQPTGWPSLVMEIGVSDPLPQLRRDAKFWLEDSGGQVNIVIIIAVKKTTKVMTIERWEDRGSTQPQRQVRPRYDLICVQALKLRENGQLSGGGSLLIPASKFFDTLPDGLGPNDITFTGQDLAEYIQWYWSSVP